MGNRIGFEKQSKKYHFEDPTSYEKTILLCQTYIYADNSKNKKEHMGVIPIDRSQTTIIKK
jgi:hypothetical protein